jgi:hypothetical protein
MKKSKPASEVRVERKNRVAVIKPTRAETDATRAAQKALGKDQSRG